MVRELTIEEYDLSYQRYLANSIENQEIIESMYVSLNESGQIESLTEGVVDAVKGFIQKIMDAISKVWEKFSRAVNNLFTNNNKWLTKYKNTILNKKPMDATLNDYYKYDIEKIKSLDCPKLDEPMNLNLDTKEKYIDSVQQFKEMMKDPKKSFTENVKAALRGGEAQNNIKASDLDMKMMYDYCMNYNKEIKDKIYQSIDNLKDANKKAYRIVDKLARGAKSTFNSKNNVTANNNDNKESGNDQKTDGNNQQQNNTGNGGDGNTDQQKQEAFTYADTMAYYFNEMDIQDDNKGNDNQQQGGGNNDQQTGNNNSQDQNGEKTDDESKKSEACIKAYFNTCSEFLGAKLNIANEAYKTFIKIMKWHVKNYDKNADLGGDNNGANGENKQGKDNTGNGDQQKGQEAQNNSASLTGSEEVTSFSENYLEEGFFSDRKAKKEEKKKEKEALQQQEWEEADKQNIIEFCKWYKKPTLGFNEMCGRLHYSAIIKFLSMIPDKNKLSHIVSAGHAKKISSISAYDKSLYKKYLDYYEFCGADEVMFAISADKKKLVSLEYDSDTIVSYNAYDIADRLADDLPDKSEIRRICKKYNLTEEAKIFGITLNEASYDNRFDSSFLEAVTSKFGSIEERTEPDDPFKGLSFM